MTITHGSLFTGVGGVDLGFDKAGIETVWQCEINKQARSVLAKHWPNATRYTDVAAVNGAEVTPVDIITFGSPCQDLSVAGKRAGFQDGTRSNLYFEAIRIIKEMREKTNDQYPRFAVWENVRGALSSNQGADFLAAVEALADIGAVDIYWRVVNTCHFGPPQRRVRVFLVADFGGERAGEILAQPTRVCWHPSQIGEAGPETTGETEDGTGSGGWNTARDTASTLQTGGVAGTRIDAEAAAGGQLLWCRDVSRVIAAKIAKGTDGPAGDEHHAPIAYTKGRRAMSTDDYETWDEDRPAPTLNVFDNASETRATVLSVYHYDEYNQKLEGDGSYRTLRTGKASGDFVAEPEVTGYRVRRLTPRECERPQGWPDDHTRWADDDKEISDSARYKMCGNGISAPVAQWLGENIVKAIEADK